MPTIPNKLVSLLVLAAIVQKVHCDCAYYVNSTKFPNPVQDPTPFIVSDTNVCTEYRGKLGCCNDWTSQVQAASYGKLDAVFGNGAGGCDVCAVNLKRFWCYYSCSPRQSEFMRVGDYVTIPDPSSPQKMVTVEEIDLWVQSDTACKLFGSCSRTAYASQVSAMQTPAGFLSFQGTNAVDDGVQTINIKFTNDPAKGIFIDNFDPCDADYSNQTAYGFNVTGNCSCNSCKERCQASSQYVPTGPLEGFNWPLVSIVWGAAIILSIAVSSYRWVIHRNATR